ncbi:IS1595 family transposase [Thalassobaculum sp.]|uniref:IS1595 family transposase n=1 Tax=Thalassobaculum sp. TaxID=2022740 RepID=UPI0032EC0FA9
MNAIQLAAYFADEDKAIELVESLMWPNGAVCPHCEATDRQFRLQGQATRKGLWKCGHCRKQYTVKVGTIFEGSHIGLNKWLFAIYLMCSSKKGVSANQLKRELGISYKSAWLLCNRVREAMNVEPLRGMLGGGGGIIEIDETYVGGKVQNNKHKNKTAAAGKKTIVMTLVDREGDARTFVVPNTKKSTLQTIARPVVSGTAHIVTDENPSYRGIAKHFASHHTVDHSKTYVRSIIFHTNFAESYHSLLKRGLIGAYHHVSEKHLHRYLREFEYRWNTRKEDDGDRAFAAIRQARGKRLLYRMPSDQRAN